MVSIFALFYPPKLKFVGGGPAGAVNAYPETKQINRIISHMSFWITCYKVWITTSICFADKIGRVLRGFTYLSNVLVHYKFAIILIFICLIICYIMLFFAISC